jgi:hypothetical protein
MKYATSQGRSSVHRRVKTWSWASGPGTQVLRLVPAKGGGASESRESLEADDAEVRYVTGYA